MNTSLLNYEKYVVNLVVDGGQHTAHLADYVRLVELWTSKADRVDDVEALVREDLELVWVEAIANIKTTEVDAVHLAALLEQAVGNSRLADTLDAEQDDRFLSFRKRL